MYHYDVFDCQKLNPGYPVRYLEHKRKSILNNPKLFYCQEIPRPSHEDRFQNRYCCNDDYRLIVTGIEDLSSSPVARSLLRSNREASGWEYKSCKKSKSKQRKKDEKIFEVIHFPKPVSEFMPQPFTSCYDPCPNRSHHQVPAHNCDCHNSVTHHQDHHNCVRYG